MPPPVPPPACAAEAASSPRRPVAITRGPAHHFFGYYEKSPWDASGRYVLSHEVGIHGVPPAPDDEATLGVIDAADGFSWRTIGRTTAWHWQLGSELQWVPKSRSQIVYNVRRGEGFGGVFRDALYESQLVPSDAFPGVDAVPTAALRPGACVGPCPAPAGR
ncbi:MAG: hypothetical protein ACYTKD_00540, partial [Planctomycetota bacterium]